MSKSILLYFFLPAVVFFAVPASALALTCDPGYEIDNGQCIKTLTITPANPPSGTGGSSLTSGPTGIAGGSNTLSTGASSVAGQTAGQPLSYTPLEPIQGFTAGANGTALDFPHLLSSLYVILITMGGLFSVVMITISGVRYMLSDIATEKSDAKKRIWACVWGLLLIAGSYLILHTINPQLLNFNLTPCEPGQNCTIKPPPVTTPAPAAAPCVTISCLPADEQAAVTDCSNALQNGGTCSQADKDTSATAQQQLSQACNSNGTVFTTNSVPGASAIPGGLTCTNGGNALLNSSNDAYQKKVGNAFVPYTKCDDLPTGGICLN